MGEDLRVHVRWLLVSFQGLSERQPGCRCRGQLPWLRHADRTVVATANADDTILVDQPFHRPRCRVRAGPRYRRRSVQPDGPLCRLVALRSSTAIMHCVTHGFAADNSAGRGERRETADLDRLHGHVVSLLRRGLQLRLEQPLPGLRVRLLLSGSPTVSVWPPQAVRMSASKARNSAMRTRIRDFAI